MNTKARNFEDDFLSGRYFLHYSGGKKIFQHPRKFYNEEILLLGEKEKDSFLQEGKLVHALMLENATFRDKYVVSDVRLPSDNVKSIIDEIFRFKFSDNLLDHRDLVLDAMKATSFHAAMVDMDKKFLKVGSEEGLAYWDHLVKCTGKIIVDPKMYADCERKASLINEDVEATRLLIPRKGMLFNELYIEMEFDSESVGLAGTEDNFVLDFENNMVRVNDLKTSSQPLSKVAAVVEGYHYWMQAVIYKKLALHYAQNLGMVGAGFEFHFIVSDVYDTVYCFPVSDETWVKWEAMFGEFWKRFRFHYDSRNWSVPMEFAKPGSFIL